MLSAVLSRCVGCASCQVKCTWVQTNSRATQSSCSLQETSSSQHVGQKGADQNGGAQDPQEHARSVVEQCVATQLLQPDLQLPVDSQAVAKKVVCRAVVVPPPQHRHSMSGVSGCIWRSVAQVPLCCPRYLELPMPETVWYFMWAPQGSSCVLPGCWVSRNDCPH